jgi:hypothetical protein
MYNTESNTPRRKVSLVVSEQKHHNTNDNALQDSIPRIITPLNSQPESHSTSSTDIKTDSNTPLGSSLSKTRLQLLRETSPPMEHAYSITCTNDKVKRPSSEEKFQSYINKLNAIDDTDDTYIRSAQESEVHKFHPHHHRHFSDIAPERTRHRKRGSIPMIGSLVYYKSKSDEALVSKNNSQYDLNHKVIPQTAHPEMAISDSETEDAFPVLPKGYRHFSSPEMCTSHPPHLHDACHPRYFDDDEFNLINNKINSQMHLNAQIFQKHISEEQQRSHFRNAHYHIPGVDPELSSDPSQNVTPTDISPNQSRSGSSSKLLDTNTSSQIPKNARHRRRLTCAMIFTPPKVVEI